MTNASIADLNICSAFGAFDDAELIKDAYWRFRNRDDEYLAEHKALVFAKVQDFLRRARRLAHFGTDTDRAWIEVSDFIVERLRALPGRVDAFALPPVSATVALADKIDTLMGFFAIEVRPDGSGDPYALRRAANGVIRIAAAALNE